MFTGLGHQLRKSMKEEGGAKLNKYELEKALCDFHIDVPNEVMSCPFPARLFSCMLHN